MKRIVMLALTLPIFLVGCGAAESVQETDHGAERIEDVQQFDVDSGGDTFVFPTTVDGVDCIVADTYEGVGISCNWASVTEPESEFE